MTNKLTYLNSSSSISVVIPAYNEEKYIENCLKSLINQTVIPNEIIVVNNNSTDNTAKIASKFSVRIITEKNQGMTYARNKGFNSSRFEIIARTDADTILPKDWIENIIKHFNKDDVIAISGPGKFYDLPNLIQNSKVKTKPTFLKWIKSYNIIINRILKHDCLYGPNYSLRKTAWEAIKNSTCSNDNEVHEDLDLAIHLAPLGKIIFDNNHVVNTSVRRWKRPEAYFEYLFRGLKTIKKHNEFKFRKKIKRLLTSKFLYSN